MNDFNNLLIDSVNSLIKQVFGSKSSNLVLNYINNCDSLDAENQDFEKLMEKLKQLFGSEISSILLNESMRNLHYALQNEYRQAKDYLDFLEQIYKTKFDMIVTKLSKHSVSFN